MIVIVRSVDCVGNSNEGLTMRKKNEHLSGVCGYKPGESLRRVGDGGEWVNLSLRYPQRIHWVVRIAVNMRTGWGGCWGKRGRSCEEGGEKDIHGSHRDGDGTGDKSGAELKLKTRP